MKTLFRLAFVVSASAVSSVQAASETQQWAREFPVGSEAALQVRNVWGTINVSGYDGDNIVVEVTEVRRARSDRDLERSKENIYLEVEQDGDLVALEVTGPNGRNRSWHCRGCELDIDYTIRVPRSSELYLSTVNDGEIIVEGVEGPINARHVNGPIRIDNAHGCEELSSINGRVDVSFATSPNSDCEIHTINGDMVVRLPESSDLDLAFNLNNGRVRSSLDVSPNQRSPQVEREEDGGRTRYKIRQSTGVRIGNGGALVSFESMNGNVHIKHHD